MGLIKGKKIGGRGCPSCGTHNTEGVARGGAQWCLDCGHRWAPCTPHCRGYEVSITGDKPKVTGCSKCGVPDKIAAWWPEAYRKLAAALQEVKFEAVD